MKQSSNLSFSSLLEEYVNAEARLLSYTRKHPMAMLVAASSLGFAFGCFGVMRVLQASMALGLREKVLLKDFFKSDEKTLINSIHSIREPHAQA